jgi:hypothetical protein
MIRGTRQNFEARLRQRGYTVNEVRECVVSEDGDFVTVDETHSAYPREIKPGYRQPAWTPLGQRAASAGPGTELTKLVARFGIAYTPGCSCRSMAVKMNALGPDWCERDGMPEILSVMRTEHAKRWQARQTILPWSDLGARQLVLLACRRARAKAEG